jgi:DNA-binding transcriptional MocR family regulator
VVPAERPIRTAAALADLIREQIADGTLPPRTRVPSERELMQHYGLGRDAVRRAVDILEYEGILVVRQGHYSEVADFGEKQDIDLEPGCRVEARMPTPAEREQLDMPQGWPVLHVVYPDGSGDLFPAHRYRVRLMERGET